MSCRGIYRCRASIPQPRPSPTPRLRHFTYGASLQQQMPVFSAGSKESELATMLSSLLAPNGRWVLSTSGRGVERAFKFRTFKSAWAFMNKIEDECRKARHHPEWSNAYNSVFVRWTTHHPPGLSRIDLAMAHLCDRFASMKENGDASPSRDADTLRPLAEQATTGSEDGGGKSEKEEQLQKKKEAIEKEEDDPKGQQGNAADIGGQPS